MLDQKVDAVDGLTSGFNINPFYFYALTGSAHYDEGDGNACEGPHSEAELNATTLNAGETATGMAAVRPALPARQGRLRPEPDRAAAGLLGVLTWSRPLASGAVSGWLFPANPPRDSLITSRPPGPSRVPHHARRDHVRITDHTAR